MGVSARPSATDAGPRLLLEWPHERGRAWRWAGSIALHVAGLFLLTLVPPSVLVPASQLAEWRNVTPLVAPPQVLTQTAPNRGKASQEVTLEGLLARRRIYVPPGPAASASTRPAQPIPEPPKIESQMAEAQVPPSLPGAAAAGAPPPQIQTEETPKLAFETPGLPARVSPPSGGQAPRPRLTPPGDSVTEAMRDAIRAGARGTAVGDADVSGLGGIGSGLNLPSSPGRTASALELMSDPMGVDFRPYLIRILAAVKRNWLAVIPESARLGRVGRVQIQFAVARDGSVPKLVIAMPSGTDALDRAAVAGISASTPFPPLPSEFRGEQVRLQFTFTYNMR
jgi:TonB family protein